jgi:hypothetical protein
METSTLTSRICPDILPCLLETIINHRIGVKQMETLVLMALAIIHSNMIIKEITISCWTQVLLEGQSE